MKKKILVSLTALFLLLMLGTVSVFATDIQFTKNPFTDIKETDYFYDAVLWAVENGITAGTTTTAFGPKNTCTRAQAVTFLWREQGKPEPVTTENPFTDIKETNYFYKAVLWASEEGITSGIGNQLFNPDGIVTREQFVSFLWRSEGKPEPVTENTFEDVASNKYYQKAVSWAAENQITSGVTKTEFGVGNPCTRGQVVSFLYRMLHTDKAPDTDETPDIDDTPEVSTDFILEMLEAVNAERIKAGVTPLELFEPINLTAQEKAEDLYNTGVFDHYSENLGYFYDQYNKAAITYEGGGENIARGYGSVKTVMIGWMNSPGHAANILQPEFTHLGVGYYKGFWVQQFAVNPKLGETIACEKCGGRIGVDEYLYTSKDAEGNVYGIYQCKNCAYMIEKCPKCETGCFEDAGLTENGSLASRCNVCGNKKTKTCIEYCPTCNEKILHNTKTVDYGISFDSTGTYDGTSYDRMPGCYFQAIKISPMICKNCNSIVLISPYNRQLYDESYALLCEKLGSAENIYEHIFWEKCIGYELVETNGNTTVYKQIFEFVDTPNVLELSELIGVKEI